MPGSEAQASGAGGDQRAEAADSASDPRSPQQRGPRSLAGQISGYGRLMRFDRPIGIWLLLWPVLWGLWLASDGRPDQYVFVAFVLGVILMRAAGCVINDFADRRIDPHVARTRNRPLATGEVQPAEALVLFAGLILIALGLVLTLNRLTQLMSLVGALLTLAYPFSKRIMSLPQLILGLAFGWAVPMVYAAQLATVPRQGWLLYLATIIWVVVYDTLYAMADRPDDLRIGVKSSAILFGDADRSIVGVLQALFIVAMFLIGRQAERGHWYWAGLLAAVALFAYQQTLIREREPQKCFRAFLNNHYLGACVFIGILLDYLFNGPP